MEVGKRKLNDGNCLTETSDKRRKTKTETKPNRSSDRKWKLAHL